MVTMQPCEVKVPWPLATSLPLQQYRYSPVSALTSTTFPGLLSSTRHRLNTFSLKPQCATLPAASVAVQFTVVEPTGKVEPVGGLHVTARPLAQLSVAAGYA